MDRTGDERSIRPPERDRSPEGSGEHACIAGEALGQLGRILQTRENAGARDQPRDLIVQDFCGAGGPIDQLGLVQTCGQIHAADRGDRLQPERWE
ncbi:MAG TPA: hypothetical protein VHS58_21530 [Acetobacteraceae bacterium]|nr:hypothetical protein [Acetobacteraceae bacterium]